MTRWTENNTEGFTPTELNMMNAAQEQLEAAHPGVDPSNIADIINNAFRPGVTVADLVAAWPK